MNEFEKIFREHEGAVIHKWNHYFEIYDRHFRRFKGKKVVLLEIGVSKGGSLEMWRKYFGEDCEIVGVDINPLCKQFENEKTKIFIGPQQDKDFLRTIKQAVPKVDIVIDDGSHMMRHLRSTFDELYNWVDENGVYLVEDLHTCYWFDYEGGYKRKNTFLEYCKDLSDQLNAWHSRQKRFKVNAFTRSTASMHFYDSIVVFEKRPMKEPTHSFSGKEQHAEIEHGAPEIEGWWNRVKNKLYRHLGINL